MANCCICNKKMGIFEGSPISIDKGLDSFAICGSCSSSINQIRAGEVDGYRKIKSYIETIANQDLKKYLLEISKELIEEDTIQNEREAELKKQQYEFAAQLQKIRMTTGYNFEGYRIMDYKSVISGECVLGTGFLSEFTASISDITGTNSNTFSNKLKDAKNVAMENMKRSCLQDGGNAIIGVDFDYITFSNNMIGVVANGTSVVIEKI